MALAIDTPIQLWPTRFGNFPVKASTRIYQGAALGEDGTTGYARGLVAGDNFLGFAYTGGADNSAGAAGAKRIPAVTAGVAELEVVGASAATNLGVTVYASADGTFTLSSTGNSAIGKVDQWISGTRCKVNFEATIVRSI